MNASEKLSAPLRGAEHYNQIDPSTNVRKTLDTTMEVKHTQCMAERADANAFQVLAPQPTWAQTRIR